MSVGTNKFSIAPNSFARAIVHHEGKEFIVEFKFDVATIREKAPSAPPQFTPSSAAHAFNHRARPERETDGD